MSTMHIISARVDDSEYRGLRNISTSLETSRNQVLRALIRYAIDLPGDELQNILATRGVTPSEPASVSGRPRRPARRFRGDRLRTYRNGLGLSREEVAAAIGVSSAAISRWEDGTRTPGPRNARKLTEFIRSKLSAQQDDRKRERQHGYQVITG